MDPLQPVNASYTYHNFRFNPNFAIDTQRDRAWWMQQYDNPHAAGDNGYALQLMSADLDNLDGRTSVLTAICNTHAGQLFVDPTSGDTVFQSCVSPPPRQPHCRVQSLRSAQLSLRFCA